MEFPRTVGSPLMSLSGLVDDEAAAGRNSQPMSGRHVLVVASRRETRNAIRETVRQMGLMVDYVTSIEEAREFCGHGLPHAIVYEAALAGANFQKLRAQWAAEAPALVFIEINEEGHGHAVSSLGGFRTSRIGRNAVMTALPNALLAELAQAA
jgi:CheY-like chemotaxis protein